MATAQWRRVRPACGRGVTSAAHSLSLEILSLEASVCCPRTSASPTDDPHLRLLAERIVTAAHRHAPNAPQRGNDPRGCKGVQ